MPKRYKEESKKIKNIEKKANIIFKQRKQIVNILPSILALVMMIMNGHIVFYGFTTKYPFLVWCVLCVLSIPFYIIMFTMISFIPKFKTKEEQMCYEISSYLKDYSWRCVYQIIKNNIISEKIDNVLLNILQKKIDRNTRKDELVKIILKDELLEINDNKLIFKKERIYKEKRRRLSFQKIKMR